MTSQANDYDALDKVFGDHGTLAKEQAFYAVLACAVLADDMEHESEAEELRALAHRTRTLHGIKPKAFKKLQELVKPFLASPSTRDNLLANSCESLRLLGLPDMAPSVYAHACDIVFADAAVVPLEKAFLKKLAGLLKIEPPEALRIIDFIRVKNQF